MPRMLPPTEELLKEIREGIGSRRVSQDELAEALQIHQSVLSRILRGDRVLSYGMAKDILDVLNRMESLIPPDAKARDYATLRRGLQVAKTEELLTDVAKRMFDTGFSQLPVLDDASMCVGMITEMSVIRFLLSPMAAKAGASKRLGELKVQDLLVQRRIRSKKKESTLVGWGKPEPRYLEEPIMFSPEEPLRKIAASMWHNYAVLIGEERNIEGILTRADFLKLTKKFSEKQ